MASSLHRTLKFLLLHCILLISFWSYVNWMTSLIRYRSYINKKEISWWLYWEKYSYFAILKMMFWILCGTILPYLEQLNSAKGAEECYRPRKAMADPSCLGWLWEQTVEKDSSQEQCRTWSHWCDCMSSRLPLSVQCHLQMQTKDTWNITTYHLSTHHVSIHSFIRLLMHSFFHSFIRSFTNLTDEFLVLFMVLTSPLATKKHLIELHKWRIECRYNFHYIQQQLLITHLVIYMEPFLNLSKAEIYLKNLCIDGGRWTRWLQQQTIFRSQPNKEKFIKASLYLHHPNVGFN